MTPQERRYISAVLSEDGRRARAYVRRQDVHERLRARAMMNAVESSRLAKRVLGEDL